MAALEREPPEEAGARAASFTPFGVWRCYSSAATPDRPHIPRPDLCRLAGYGDVEISGESTAPAGGERIAEAAFVSADEVARRLRAAGRPELAALCALAARIRTG